MKPTQSKVSASTPVILGPGNWLEVTAVIAAFIVVGAITFGII